MLIGCRLESQAANVSGKLQAVASNSMDYANLQQTLDAWSFNSTQTDGRREVQQLVDRIYSLVQRKLVALMVCVS